jgi:hypothetical protein
MPPHVGIFFVVGDKLFIDSTPLSAAGHYADHLIHDRGHDEYWAQLVKMGAVPGTGYEDYPRGRVAYDNKSGEFILLADACILHENKVLDAIMSRQHLPIDDMETGTAPIYRCHLCLRRKS